MNWNSGPNARKVLGQVIQMSLTMTHHRYRLTNSISCLWPSKGIQQMQWKLFYQVQYLNMPPALIQSPNCLTQQWTGPTAVSLQQIHFCVRELAASKESAGCEFWASTVPRGMFCWVTDGPSQNITALKAPEIEPRWEKDGWRGCERGRLCDSLVLSLSETIKYN